MTFERFGIMGFQCDLPAPGEEAQPAEVQAAAATLLAASTRRQRQPGRGVTGWLDREDAVVWQAFLTFAPYAYDADAYDATMHRLADVCDEGTSVAFALTDDQFSAASEAIAPLRLVPLAMRRHNSRRTP